jgi:hypothetical protein
MTASSARLVDPVGELTCDAKCGVARSHRLDVFDEYSPPWELSGNDKEPTQLAIRFETFPSRWRTARWWASFLIVVAAATAGGKLMGSRRSSARHHHQRLERSTTSVLRLPRVEPQARHRSPRPTRVHPPRRAGHSQHRAGGKLRHRTTLSRRRLVRSLPVIARPVERTPPVPGAERPGAHRETPTGQFSYLGK